MDRRWTDRHMSEMSGRFGGWLGFRLSDHKRVSSADARPLVLTRFVKLGHYTPVARAWLLAILRARVPRKKSGGCGVYVVTRAASASLPVFAAKASSPGHSIIRFQASRYWSTD